MNKIAENEYYVIQVEPGKNRFYLRVMGFWKNTSIVPNYLTDIEKGVKMLRSGFCIISDLREMKTPPQEVGILHEKAQKVLVLAGLDRTAEVLSDAILKMALNKYSINSQMKKQAFSTVEEAEKWLKI
jgi:hypothetical protein